METVAAPALDAEFFDSVATKLATAGPAAAAEQLCEMLQGSGDFAKLFYAKLLKKRVEMGVSPIPTASAADFTPQQQEEYENAIREACRTVGKLYLDSGQIPQAFGYYRMIGELGPVVAALDKYQPAEDEDIQPIVDVAYYQGANVKRGFDLVLERYGICNAITTANQFDPAHGMEGRHYCVQKLVRSLHAQLLERLKMAVQEQQGFPPTASSIPEMIEGRDWLFANDAYYTDTSHLSSVVQMSVELESPEELRLARELCTYGKRLAPTLQYPGNPPFENLYSDVKTYLDVLLGDEAEVGIKHFKSKITADPDGPDTFAAEVLVRLLLRLKRDKEALEVARVYLLNVDERQLNVPGVFELSQRLKDYRALAEAAQLRKDPVHYLAGLIAARQ